VVGFKIDDRVQLFDLYFVISFRHDETGLGALFRTTHAIAQDPKKRK
jgi:hypothetical protein